MHSLSRWLSGITAVTNSNNESVSSWNLSYWILTSIELSLLLFIFWEFFYNSVSWWSFSGVWVSASPPQVSWTHFSSPAVFNNVVVWMVSTRPLISKCSRPFKNPLVTLPKTPTTIAIISTFMFHSFFDSLERSRYLSFSLYFSWDRKVHNFAGSLFLLLIIIKSGRLAEIRWSVCNSKSHSSLCVSFFRTGGLCIYPLFVWSNLKLPDDHSIDLGLLI